MRKWLIISKWFTTNLGIKVLSFFTALLLWFHVITERTYEITVNAPIQCILGKGVIFTKHPPQSVKVRIKGKGKELLRFKNSARVLLDLSETELGWKRIELKKDDIELLPESKITVVSAPSPKSFVVRIEEEARKMVKITPVLTSEVNFEVIPEFIEVSGGKSAVTPLSKIATEEINPPPKLPTTLKVKLIIPENVKASTDLVTVILKSQ